MKYYYVAGIPYPDELYHYGIKGQKWGVRRFQNADGSYTLVGKQRYGRISEATMNKLKTAGSKIASGTKKAAKAVGSAAKKLKDRKVQQYKKKHPWMMSDEELKRETDRINMEVKYKQAVNDLKSKNRVKSVVKDILESGVKTLGTKAFTALGDSIFGKKDKPIRDLKDVLNDDKATAKELETAIKAHEAKNTLEKERYENKRYDLQNLGDTRNMSKKQLDNLNAWLSSERRTSQSLKNTEDYQIGREALDDWLEKASTRGNSRRIGY